VELTTSGPLSRRGERASQSWILDFASPALEELDGRHTNSNGGHWTVVGGVDPNIDGFLRPNAPPPRKRSITIADRRVALYTMPTYEQGGRRNDARLIAMTRALIQEQEQCPRPRSGRACRLVFPRRSPTPDS
jgi:hypothetical protein